MISLIFKHLWITTYFSGYKLNTFASMSRIVSLTKESMSLIVFQINAINNYVKTIKKYIYLKIYIF